MKSKLIIISAIYCFFALACQSKVSDEESSKAVPALNPSQENNQPDTANDNSGIQNAKEKLPDELQIKGKDIWVRDVASTGKIVMKLNEGDICKILDKGKLSVVKGLPDHWYQLEFNKKTGWVFGSQTDLALFKSADKPITGSLDACDDEIVKSIETPPSYSYSFKSDNTFQFTVAAGFSIRGKHEWVNNVLTLKPDKLILDTPDGSSESDLKGSLSFSVYVHEQLICLVEKENKLPDKNYIPHGGCFCLNH